MVRADQRRPREARQDLLALDSRAADEAPEDGSNDAMDGFPRDPRVARELPALHGAPAGSTIRASQ